MGESILSKNIITILISDLKLKTIIGIYPWERRIKQNVVINVTLSYNAAKAIANDSIKETVDYKAMTKQIIQRVRTSRFFLLEKLTYMVLSTVMENKYVLEATVRVDKPKALRFARSVSAELTAKRF